ncbi:hypothetical protein TNCV_4940281 [Trichonephila clavipes]|nr:hypothetical protein TNCV_4940281 [Trichonephila clavipes]
MAAVDFLHHENPSTWAGVEPATLGTEGQRQTNHATQPTGIITRNQICKATHGRKRLRKAIGGIVRRNIEEVDLHYRSHLIRYQPQRSMEPFTNTKMVDMHLIYGLAEEKQQKDCLEKGTHRKMHITFTNLHQNL